MTKTLTRWLLLAAPVSIGVALPASAADTPGSTGIQEIVVTAERHESSAQSAAAAVSAATGAELQDLGITEVKELDALVPSAQFTTLRQQTLIYMRGIGQSLSAPNADPAIAVNVNDVYIPAEMTGSAFYDLDRVEVLPGPQGTLYGRNAAGGVVNLITHRPTHEFGADGTLELGNYSLVNATGALNLPIGETVALRAAGNRNQHNGWFSNGAMDRETTSGRLTGLYTPSADTSLLLVGSYSHDGGIGLANQNNPPLAGNWYLPFDPKANNLFTDADTWNASLQLKHRFTEKYELTYLAGFSDLNGLNNVEFLLGAHPLTPASVLGSTKSRLYTHELRLAGATGPVDWLMGLYTYTGRVDFFTNSVIAQPVHILNGPFLQHSKGYAGFLQGGYSLTERARLTAGLRYSYDKKDFDGSNSTVIGATRASFQPYSGERSWNRVDWRAAFEYNLSLDSLLYGSVQTGYNQGGFSTTPLTPTDPRAATFDPEKVLAYTVGSKNKFLNNHAVVNAEAFYYKYDNYQVSARNLITAQNQVFNAQKAQIYGLDLTTELLLGDDDKLLFDGSYLNAKATRLVLPVAPFANFSGYDLPFAPRVSARTSLQHSFHLGDKGTVEAEASYRWIAGMWGVYNHLKGSFIPSHGFVDAAITYRPPVQRWSISLWGRNLGNTFTYQLINGNAIPGPGAGFPDAPLTYGVRITAAF
jgi:iron complex outermembrane receptor protein